MGNDIYGKNWKGNKIKAELEYDLHNCHNAYGETACICGPNPDRHFKTLFPKLNGEGIHFIDYKYSVYRIIKDFFDKSRNKIIAEYRRKGKIKVYHTKVENMGSSIGIAKIIDLDLMQSIKNCLSIFKFALKHQRDNERNQTSVKVLMGAFCLRGGGKRPKTIKALNELLEMLGTEIIGLDGMKNAWSIYRPFREGRKDRPIKHYPNFKNEDRGRVRNLIVYTYREELEKGKHGSPMFTFLIEYV